jgi:hypothetical protein
MKRAILKHTADALEKLAIGSLLIGLFQQQQIGVILSIACFAASYIITVWEVKL